MGSVDERSGGKVDDPALENGGVDDPVGNFGISAIGIGAECVRGCCFYHGSVSFTHGSSLSAFANSMGKILGPEMSDVP